MNDAVRGGIRKAVSDFELAGDIEGESQEDGVLAVGIQKQRGAIESKGLGAMKSKVGELFNPHGLSEDAVIFSMVIIRDIDPGDMIRAAATNAQKRKQELRQKDAEIDLQKKENERLVLEAKGIKEYEEMISQSASPTLLAWKWIEMMNNSWESLKDMPNTKIVFWPMPPEGVYNTMDLDALGTK